MHLANVGASDFAYQQIRIHLANKPC